MANQKDWHLAMPKVMLKELQMGLRSDWQKGTLKDCQKVTH